MSAARRLGLVAFLCVGSTGCAILPVIGVNLAAQGAQGLAALTLGSLAAMQERSEQDRCLVFTGKGVSITESLESAIPADEGEVRTFDPASWRPEFAREGYPQAERSRTPAEGALVIGERSVLFIPAPGATRLRIPYELVQDIQIRASSVDGEPRSMIVQSCFGRYDIVTFGPQQPNPPDPDATAAAAAQLKARVAAFHATAGK